MIAISPPDGTPCSNDSTTTTELFVRRADDIIALDVDTRVWREVCDFFPVVGENYQTIKLNQECRKIVTTSILSALRDTKGCFSFNTEVQDKMSMVLSRKRKKLVEYFDQSRFFKVTVKHSKGHHSIIRSLKGVRLQHLYAYQHNMTGLEDGGLGSVLPSPSCRSSLVTASSVRYRSVDSLWKFTGETSQVLLQADWFSQYGRSFRNACTSLHAEQWEFVSCIETSLQQCVIGRPTYAECLEIARHRRPKTDRSGHVIDSWTPEEIAGVLMDRWEEWRHDPLFYLFRVEGRCYYPLVNQSKLLRQRHIRFIWNSNDVGMADVDLSSAYWVLLASMLDDSPCRTRLIQDLAEDRFYYRLNQEVGGLYSDKSELKIAVQKECLFGKKGFGRTPLFSAMARLYHDLAKFIMYKRKNHNVSWLSDLLTNAEGSFFIDRVLPFIVAAGVPALPIHDGIIVPAPAAEQVSRWCSELAMDQFGFEPKFKVTHGLAP